MMKMRDWDGMQQNPWRIVRSSQWPELEESVPAFGKFVKYEKTAVHVVEREYEHRIAEDLRRKGGSRRAAVARHPRDPLVDKLLTSRTRAERDYVLFQRFRKGERGRAVWDMMWSG